MIGENSITKIFCSHPKPVVIDPEKPVITSARVLNRISIELSFNVELDKSSAEDISKYEIINISNGGIAIQVISAELSSPNHIILTTEMLDINPFYMITVRQIKGVNGKVSDTDTLLQYNY